MVCDFSSYHDDLRQLGDFCSGASALDDTRSNVNLERPLHLADSSALASVTVKLRLPGPLLSLIAYVLPLPVVSVSAP